MRNVTISHQYGRPNTVGGDSDSAKLSCKLCEICMKIASRARRFPHCSNWLTLDLLCMVMIFLLFWALGAYRSELGDYRYFDHIVYDSAVDNVSHTQWQEPDLITMWNKY